MTAIHHRIELTCTPEKLHNALHTPEGLSAWWAPAESADGTHRFRFGADHVVRMRVDEASDQHIAWTCVEGPWENHKIHFRIEGQESTVLRFVHEGWREADDFLAHCTSKWGFFLAVSLKNLLEKGEGCPSPHEPRI